MSLLRISRNTISRAIHLTNKNLTGKISTFGLLKRIVKPPMSAISDHPGKSNSSFHRLHLLRRRFHLTNSAVLLFLGGSCSDELVQ
uniref:Uncharacterized protein n=1 Tax=Medicago truncatula TaxID=3880 RepID=I3S1I8_MEDTR|nr:unknown [Medicago truncatula]